MSETHEGHHSSHRGFAAMDAAKQREIASKGGRAAHQKGTAHEFTSAEARAAGRKGGYSVSQDRAHMAEIGRQGGRARGQRHHHAADEQRVSEVQKAEAPVASSASPAAENRLETQIERLESLEQAPGLPQ